MNSHISSKTSTFSAPVVQSRLEHHHQQQLKQPEARQFQHQRSKSLNKGKRYNYNSYHQKTKETTTFTSSSTSSTTTEVARNNNKNFSNFNNNFDLSYYRDNNFVENGQLQRKTSTSSRPPRRHQHSDSVDEDKFRVTPTISILKRPQSATDFVKTTSNSKSTFSLDVTQEEQGFNVNNNHRSNNKVWERSPPQQRSQSKERRRSDATLSKTKRSQRKEVKSMEFETDLLFNINSSQPNTTTQQLSGSGDESDVNSNNNKYVKPVSTNAVIFPPLNYSNAIIALEEGMMNSNKKEDTYSNSDDNATVKRVNKKRPDEPAPRRLSSTAIELQSQVSRFADSESILFSESMLPSTSPPARRPSSSPSRLGGCGPKLYAGPTFHNSPAPSDLPMPSFYGKSLGKDPSPLSVGSNLFTVPENAPSPPPNVHSNYDAYSSPSSGNTSDDDIFAMDDLEPSKVPYYPEPPTLRKQESQELLHILAAANVRQHPTAASYMVPERMATAHHPMQVHPVNLNEISETLRSLLKIHGQ
jgi:hypothetical protein